MRPVWVGKRQGNRTQCLLKAQIFIDDGVPLTDAQLLDLSPTGARIKIAADVKLPATFQMHIPSRLETRHCKIRWQRDATMGIEFFKSTEIDAHNTLQTLAGRVAALEMRTSGATAAAAATVPSPQSGDRDLDALTARLDRMERDLAHSQDILQDLVADTMSYNLAPRFAAFEEKNTEILHTLRKLIPILAGKAL